VRERVVDFLKHYHRLSGLAMVQLLFWLGLSPRKFQRWKDHYGKANEDNAMIPRDHPVRSPLPVGRLSQAYFHDVGR
jgi:hypothetical protein